MLFQLTISKLLIVGLICVAESRTKGDPYIYHIEAEHESLVGHVSHDAEKGSKVVAEIDQTVTENGVKVGETQYLKVLLKESQHPEKLTTANDVSMVTHHNGQITQDNLNTGSHTFNHIPTHTARLTGNDMSSSHRPGVHSLPNTQQFSSETNVVTSHARPTSPSGGFPPATNTHNGSPHQVHLTTANAAIPNNQHQFRNMIPHGHNIHITHHLVHEPVHPSVNKRSVDKQDNRKTLRQNHASRRRSRRNFAVPPEHFQPRLTNVKATAPTPPVLVVKETNAFYVDPVDHYIKVNDTALFEEHTFISFYVVLENVAGEAASNPLPFIVHIDHPEESSSHPSQEPGSHPSEESNPHEESSSYPATSAAFAGVLVLCVVFLAILIPLVTRAKRRYKEGKPMFKLGSHPSRADLEKADLENQSNMTRKPSEPNWYGNNIYYNYEDEVARERSEFSKGLRQYSTKSEPPTLQLHKKRKEPLSDNSSSSGIDSSSQGANGYDGDDSYSQRL